MAMRWHYRDPALLRLLPAGYAVHVLEEWIGGFAEWVARAAGAPMPRPTFIVINAIAMAIMIVALRAAAARESNGWLAIAVAALLFINALAHTTGTLVWRSYSPGLISGIVFYVPI